MQVYRAAFIICLIDSLSVYVNNVFNPYYNPLFHRPALVAGRGVTVMSAHPAWSASRPDL